LADERGCDGSVEVIKCLEIVQVYGAR